MLAKSLGRTFVDLDEEIVKTDGRSIPDIFAAEGEDGFRTKDVYKRQVHYGVLRRAERALAAGDMQLVEELVNKHIPHWSRGILKVTGVSLRHLLRWMARSTN